MLLLLVSYDSALAKENTANKGCRYPDITFHKHTVESADTRVTYSLFRLIILGLIECDAVNQVELLAKKHK